MVNKKNTRHRTFTAAPVSSDEAPSFDLFDETFYGRPAIQGAAILEFVSAADDTNGGSAAKQILAFYKKALTEESHTRFVALIEDPDRVVDLETLTEIVGWLVEEYTSRPTQASSQSDATS